MLDCRVKPLHYISWLIGHEGAGSVLSLLRKKWVRLSVHTFIIKSFWIKWESNEMLCIWRCWAMGLFAGNSETGFDQNTTYSIFSVSITLSDEGFQNFFQVWKSLHVGSIKSSGVFMWCDSFYSSFYLFIYIYIICVVVGHSYSLPVSEDASVHWTSAEVGSRSSKPFFSFDNVLQSFWFY